jgi:hypothetical protein
MPTFDEYYAAWRARPFPSGSATDAVDELHADLAGVDAVVAEAVVPFVKHGTYHPAKIDVIGELERLADTAVQLADSGSDEDRSLARAYHDYLEVLTDLYGAFLAREDG